MTHRFPIKTISAISGFFRRTIKSTPCGYASRDNMHPRGVKRQPEQRGKSPIQKRPRSEERDETPQPKVPWSIRHGVLNKEEYQRISNAMLEFYEKKEQAQEMYVKKMKLRDALYEVMRGVFPYCGLYVVGSSMNGFGSHTSDMDLCLMLSYNDIDQKKEATEILRILHKALKKCSFLRELTLIRAKVPILKFVDKVSEVECDLNINNSVGIRNTHLLNAYSRLDWRVSCLVLFVKHWAKQQNINDASQGTISSYSLVLMVIHYMQCGCNPPVIPSLQVKYPHKFDVNTDIRLLTLNEKLPPYKSPNQDSLGELFVGFMDYYANTFDFCEDAISVRLGRRLPKEVVIKQNPVLNPPNQWKCISIEEPFNLSNTARSVFDPFIFEHVRQIIRKSYSVLRQKRDVNAVLTQPL